MATYNSAQSVRSMENAAEPLYQVKLLSALRSGDPALIHPFLAEIGKDKRKSVDGDLDTGAAALHLAVRCASAGTGILLLSYRAISPNGVHPPGSGTTPLHLAASLGRVDIINILLEQPGIDDTLRDSQGLTCRDVAKGKDVIRTIDDSRSFLNASYRSLLRTYILSPVPSQPTAPLIALLESPRVRFVNLSYLDDASGRSLLHEAARRKDLRLIELAVRAGADVFVRNSKGKMAYDGLGKDDRVRVFLRQFANQDTTLIDPPSSEPPILKGYLNKYTNVARGYGTRWFVLNNGVLSYYRHQEDENVASRGSIAMRTATLKVPTTGDKMRFEVQSAPSRGHHSSGVQKWYMKANHPVEASRWTQAIVKSIEWSKRNGVLDSAEQLRRMSGESETSAKTRGHSHRGSMSTFAPRRQESTLVADSRSSLVNAGDEGRDSPMAQDNTPEHGDEEGRDDSRDDSSAAESTGRVPPHDTTFDLHGNSTAAQMELTSQLLSNLSLPANASVRAQELKAALKDSMVVVQGMINEYVAMAKERDEWWRLKLQHEQDRQAMWEESFQTVVKEGEALEKELRMRSRKRGSRFFDTSEVSGTLRQRPALFASQQPSLPEDAEMGYFPAAATFSAQTLVASDAPQYVTVTTPMDTIGSSSVLTPVPERRHPAMPSPAMRDQFDTASLADTDEEDEFYDAIESGTLPNLDVHQLLASPTHIESKVPSTYLDQYAAYNNLRQRLPISSDNRPSTSLWSVLKHSIGKDLTKISFPVFFNEPTSMLQRMAEDMEFSECLDVAAREVDPHRRIAFVAAFAMSNYSSTIGRIAKPFNPMLGETFEYVRFDKEYRYVSEQVSHHPPISACWAESPSWSYYGEVDAQNKFMGKSFEIRPTGVAHVDLTLPEELGPEYPKATNKLVAAENKVLEHYSWKKVTTNVSGFILGSPSIDHYGEMTITNHRTEDQCVLTFKPRGWRGRDAFEISGYVRDAQGNVTYEIAGRWNKQLIAKAVGSGDGILNPDIHIGGPTSPSASSGYFLLWRNSEKPVAPFNLTPFAITLNDCPEDTLRPYICPTDCRLRPDQRAFEMGKYELANELKNEQEEKQRATRKAREEGSKLPHKPRWFTAETDGDTGERVWTPARVAEQLEYWAERERVWKNGGGCSWKDVEPIFVEQRG